MGGGGGEQEAEKIGLVKERKSTFVKERHFTAVAVRSCVTGRFCMFFQLMDDVAMPWAFGGPRMALDHSLTRFSLIYSLKSD